MVYTSKELGVCLLRLRKPQSTCVGGANLQRKLSPERVLKKALFLSANQAEHSHPARKKERPRKKELKSSSSRSLRSLQKQNFNFAQPASQQATE
jgi:hypothetical protein